MSDLKPVSRIVTGVALTALLAFHHEAVLGQTAADSDQPGPGDSRADLSEVVVTGTRITARGFSAPTPTTIINSEDIAKTAQPNIFTSVTQLPSLQGSSGTNTNTFSTSSGQQGLSSFSLRGLGTIRTLTLLDGQRVVGANVTGVPDISQFPQLLVQRVDVVTGGASASYGSDAVGGVVNFITDKRFEGVKGLLQGGITTYGDDGQFNVGLAAGHSLFDHRLHLEGSVEYDHENGVGPGQYGETLAGGRDWFKATTLLNTNKTNNGSAPVRLFEPCAIDHLFQVGSDHVTVRFPVRRSTPMALTVRSSLARRVTRASAWAAIIQPPSAPVPRWCHR